MGQEYFINSQNLEDKIRQTLPSQGGAGAGFDLTASTQIIPIIDLTETAEGSTLRQDLQSAISFNKATAFSVSNATSTIITNTGYWRLIGSINTHTSGSNMKSSIILNDGATDKIVYATNVLAPGSGNATIALNFDFIIFLEAGHSCKVTAAAASAVDGSFRQIAAIDNTLINP